MEESMTMAEMAQPANCAGMNYEGIFNYVKTQINCETKKQVGMNVMTHFYVTAMREIANDQEIVYCFMKEMLMNQSPVFSKTLDVEDQKPTPNEIRTIEVNDQTPTPDVVKSIDTPSEKSTSKTGNKLVDLAIETVMDLPLPDSIDSCYSYLANYVFKRINGELKLDKTGGYNADLSQIDTMKMIERMHMENRYKNVKIVEVGDYTVYIISNVKIQVTHFNKTDGVEPYEPDYSQAIEEAKKQVEDYKSMMSCLDSEYENLYCGTNEKEESEESLWDPEIDEWGPVPKKDVVSDEQRLIEKNVVSDEQRLIEKAVEMTKSGGVGMMTDKNAPYYVQNEFKITDTGELLPAIRPFSRNIRIDEIDSFKDSHKKRAQTYNASYVTCTDDYTAYIIDGGKTVCVFYYNTKGDVISC